MGNNLSFFKKQNKYKIIDLDKFAITNNNSINNECPICYEKINKGITLDCKHSFCFYCIQRHSIKNLIINTEIECPLCRKIITSNEIQNIYDNWSLVQLYYDNWNQKNIIYIGNININKIKLKKILLHNNNQLIIPLYKINNMYQQVMIKSPLLNKLINLKELKKIESKKSKYFTEFKEELSKLKLLLRPDFRNYKDEKKFSNFIKKILPDDFYHDNFYNNLFHIRNKYHVTAVDLIDGEMVDDIFIKNRPCSLLFSTYLILNTTNNKLKVINQIYSILYK